MSTIPPTPFFLPRPGRGQRFAVHHEPPISARSVVLYLHPFAEELNRTRRMAAIGARALAAAGHAVLQLDLLGCGDSSGDFSDATWYDWIDDVMAGAEWLQQRHPGRALTLWGLRAGALMVAEATRRGAPAHRWLFWQPAIDGEAILLGFLRLELAARMAAGASTKGVVEGLRAQLAAGESVEIAGYLLAPSLATGMQASSLGEPPTGCRVDWIEVSGREQAELLPASVRTLTAWQAKGYSAQGKAVPGAFFWQTPEMAEVPRLVEASVSALEASA